VSIVEDTNSFHALGTARVLVNDREMAWAEPFVRRSEDVRWILGNYVQTATADALIANSNGHIFPLEDMAESLPNLAHRPMNINHAPDLRVGTFVASELVYPENADFRATGGSAPAAPPVAEALAAFWYYYDEGMWDKVERAYKDGQLFFSMEAIPKQITCAKCNSLFDYAGPTDDAYCEHLQVRSAKKILHKPKFLGGALIVPPVKPGWTRANVKEITSLLEHGGVLTDDLYKDIIHDAPTLNDAQIAYVVSYLALGGI
jgi:hypothetical protein